MRAVLMKARDDVPRISEMRGTSSRFRCRVIVLLAWLGDLFLGEPPARFHPVVWIGNYLRAARGYNDRTVARGAALWLGGAAMVLGVSYGAQSFARRLSFPFNMIAFAVLLKPLFAWRALKNAAQQVVNAPDLPSARKELSWHLVSRDTSELSAGEVYGATIESVAENLSDSLIAPILFFLAGGLPLVALYRYANTADAMWGYRTADLERFGKFAARVDDALNFFPSRLTALLLIANARAANLDARRAWRVWRRDARLTSSPNAGQPMSAMAGALGRRLSKRAVYTLGAEFSKPTRRDVMRALRVANFAAWTFVTVAVMIALWKRK